MRQKDRLPPIMKYQRFSERAVVLYKEGLKQDRINPNFDDTSYD
jgi:hypothetical protein